MGFTLKRKNLLLSNFSAANSFLYMLSFIEKGDKDENVSYFP